MKKNIVLGSAFAIFLFTHPSFASSREEAINRTLTTVETLQSLGISMEDKPVEEKVVPETPYYVAIESASPTQNTQTEGLSKKDVAS